MEYFGPPPPPTVLVVAVLRFGNGIVQNKTLGIKTGENGGEQKGKEHRSK